MTELKDYISEAFTEIGGDRNSVSYCLGVLWTDLKIVARLKLDILSTLEIKYSLQGV